MLNPKKEADTLKLGELIVGNCPICNSYISHVYFMQDSVTRKQSKWYSCQCGVVWNTHKPDIIYDEKYYKKYDHFDKKIKDNYEYAVKIYSPIIEELIYGRRALFVGRTTIHQESLFEQRGWVPESIDKNSFTNPSIVGDFECHDFKGFKYNMIWMYHTFECFQDPKAALIKCRELLTEDGILFIASPDTDFIHTRGSSGFRHWKPDMNYLMWNRRAITRQLESLGLNVIMARQNCWQRFPETDDFHLIAQVKFF